MKTLNDAFPSILIFKLASKVDAFNQWLKSEHQKELRGPLIHGYKFFLETIFSTFLDHAPNEKVYNLKNNFLYRQIWQNPIYINKLPIEGEDSSEVVILLKNIYNEYEVVSKAKGIDALSSALDSFIGRVLNPVHQFYEQAIAVKPKKTMTVEDCTRLLLIKELFFSYNQIGNNGPYGYHGTFFKHYHVSEKRLESCFEGYKYTLQYLWHIVLGESTYRNCKISLLHTADSWRNYKTYNTARKNAPSYAKIMSEHFDIEEQTSLDSFFFWAKTQVVEPLEQKFQINIGSVDQFFKFNPPKTVSKKTVFGNLLLKKTTMQFVVKLTPTERLEMLLYWYPVEIVDSKKTQMHNTTAAFITLLAGSLALRNTKEKEFSKIIVCKLGTSVGRNKNDYSYGILLDAKASTGYYHSGWLLYYDCCGDYSGYSGSQHRTIEKLLKENIKKGTVILREMRVRRNDLLDYISRYSAIDSTPPETIEQVIPDESLFNAFNNINGKYGELKGLVFELLCYYFANEHYSKKPGWQVKWGGLKDDSIDLIIENDTRAIVVECKVNIDNYDWEAIERSISRRVKSIKEKATDYEFWIWHEPKVRIEALQSTGKKILILSTASREQAPFLNPVNLDKLRQLLGSQ